jgi:hypothetical protein
MRGAALSASIDQIEGKLNQAYDPGRKVSCNLPCMGFQIAARECEMKLVHVDKKVQGLLELTRLINLFEIHDEEQAALQAF